MASSTGSADWDVKVKARLTCFQGSFIGFSGSRPVGEEVSEETTASLRVSFQHAQVRVTGRERKGDKLQDKG